MGYSGKTKGVQNINASSLILSNDKFIKASKFYVLQAKLWESAVICVVAKKT